MMRLSSVEPAVLHSSRNQRLQRLHGLLADHIVLIQVVFDVALVLAAWSLSYATRFLFFVGGDHGLERVFLFWSIPLVILTLYFLLKNGLYDWDRLPSFAADVMQILRANTISIITFVVVLYFVSDLRISRLTIVIYASFSTFLLAFGRASFRSLTRKLRRRGLLIKNVLVVGDGAQSEKYVEAVSYRARSGVCIQKRLEGEPTLDRINQAVDEVQPDIVVLGFADETSPVVKEFIAQHFDSLFVIKVLPVQRQALLGLTAESIGDVHVLSLNHPRISGAETIGKRLFDFLATGLGLIVLSPVLGALAILVRLSSPGPIFFGQERVGINGRHFMMWKFRSMRVSSGTDPSAQWTVENDPRRTKIGCLMRQTSLDELPQLWNVFVGDMSLVGPRPEQPYFVDKFRSEIPAYMLRHKMKAGITGWAQVNGWRGDTSLHKRIECDLYYIRNWTFWLDIKILVFTFIKGFVNKNAY